MSFYSNMATTALRLLTKYGVQHTFTTYSVGAFDPNTGTRTETPSNYTAYAVKDVYTTLEKGSSAIKEGDIRLIAEAANYSIGDTLSLDSTTWRIMGVDPIKPGDTVVAYFLQIRK